MSELGYRPTLCWDCTNSIRPEICPWAREFIPVDGWEAEETECMDTTDRPYSSFLVKKCPLFERDACRGGTRRVEKKKPLPVINGKYSLDQTDCDIIMAYAESGMRTYRTADISHYDRRTVSNRLTSIRLKTGIDPRDFNGLCQLVRIVKKGGE